MPDGAVRDARGHDAIRFGKIEDSVLVLVGTVIGFYFKEAQDRCRNTTSRKKS